jgi:hypothetical protein
LSHSPLCGNVLDRSYESYWIALHWMLTSFWRECPLSICGRP